MYIRNSLTRSIALSLPLVVKVVPIGSIAIYQRVGVLWSKPMQEARNPGKRWLKTRIGGRTLYWAKN